MVNLGLELDVRGLVDRKKATSPLLAKKIFRLGIRERQVIQNGLNFLFIIGNDIVLVRIYARRALRRACPTALLDVGFCPVISCPSTTTFSFRQKEYNQHLIPLSK